MLLDRERLIGDKEYWAEARFRCQTDHIFLAHALGWAKISEAVHRPVADFYVQKSPGLPLEDQDPIKFRMHLWPRLTYKTTMGMVDSTQWVTVDPDVTITNLTATQPLAQAMTDTTVARAFIQPKGKAPTLFQICFPEHVVERTNSGEYNSPARTFAQLDKTLDSTSVKSTQTGWHPWVLNPDDPVDTENSGITATANVRQGVIAKYNTNLNTLQRGGYVHMRGTRYHPFELWGHTLETMDPKEWKVLISAALRVKSGQRLQAGEFPPPEEVELLFPEMLSYEELRSKFNTDYETFMCQQMNDPQGGSLAQFPIDLYRQTLMQSDRIPQFGEVSMFWRFPYGGKEFMAKYAEGVAVRIANGHAYVIDAWQGMYTQTGLAEKVVKVCQQHQVGIVEAEDSPGARYLEGHIKNESYRRNVSIRMKWAPFEENDADRFSRMEQLEPMMRSGRLSISTEVGKPQELRRQFIHYRLITENGLVDTISRLAMKVPVSLLRTELDEEELDAQRRRREQMASDMVWGAAGQAAIAEQEERKRVADALAAIGNRNSFGLPNILGGLDG